MNSKAFILTYVTVFLVATLMVGCASTNQIVSQAKGPIPADSARILLTRETHNTDSSYVITDNEINIGQIGPGGQLEWDRIAGPMKLTARLFNPLSGKFYKGYPPLTAQIGVGAGKSYHFVVHWGFGARFPELKLVSGTPIAYEESNKTDMTSTTTKATTDKQMITQNSASVASPSASAIPLENQNILGISVEPTSGVRGVVVKMVSPGSPCEGVLKPGDTIFAFDLIGQGDLRVGGAKVNGSNFQAEVSKIQSGMTVNFILNLRPLRQASCTIPANQPYTTGIGTQNAKADTYTGTVTGGNFAKGVGFSNMNVKLEVTADNSDKAIFFVRSDSKVIDAGGKQIDYLEAFRSKDKKVEIKYFTITDATGGDPSRSDFAYEIGQKGVRELRFLE